MIDKIIELIEYQSAKEVTLRDTEVMADISMIAKDIVNQSAKFKQEFSQMNERAKLKLGMDFINSLERLQNGKSK